MSDSNSMSIDEDQIAANLVKNGPLSSTDREVQKSAVESPSPSRTLRRSPRTPEIIAPPQVRPRKLVFRKEGGMQALPNDGELSKSKQVTVGLAGKENNVKRKSNSLSMSENALNSSTQSHGKRKSTKNLGHPTAKEDNPNAAVTANVRKQSPNDQEKPCKKKQRKAACKKASKPKSSITQTKLNKGDVNFNKLGNKTAYTSSRKWLSHVVIDGTKFRIGDDVYVKRTDNDFDEEEEGCLVCGKAGELIECDNCSGGVHLTCMEPPLDEVPEGDWLCASCVNKLKLGNEKHGASQQLHELHDIRERPRTAREMLMASELWAARIERIWKDTDGTCWFRGLWYLIPEETAVGRQAHNVRRELFRTNESDDNEMASIFRHCSVMSPEEFRNSGREGDDVFLCEYEYDTQFQTFRRIVDLDSCDQVSGDELFDASGLSEVEQDDEYDMVEKDVKAHKGKRASKVHDKKPLKPKPAAKAANVRSGAMFGMGKVGTKHIPEGATRIMQTDFERAKAAFRLTAAPSSLPCRGREIREISAFVTDALGVGGCSLGHCLYISGVPGTGKTATVLDVMRNLRNRAEEGNLHPFRFVEINGLRLTSPEHLYTVLHEALTGHHLGWRKALQLLDERFSHSKPSKKIDTRPCILLVDELDLLVTRNQSVLYNVFDWPTRPFSRLFVIGIANTIDLPERLLPRIASRMGLKRLSFSPYSHEQLQEIISVRLQGIQVFEKQAIQFASRKVAAVSGDARRALELCRRSVEIAEVRFSQHPVKNYAIKKQGLQPQEKLVGMTDVEDAIKEMFQASHIKMMKRCTRQAKIFLVAMVYEQHKTGTAESTFEKVALAFSYLCQSHDENCPDWDTLLLIGCGLGACRLLICEPGSRHRLQKLQLNFPSDDVCFALKEDKELGWAAKYL